MITIKVKKGIPMLMDDTDRPTFEEWMARVDRLVSRHVGISVYDLEDAPFMEWYEDRVRPIRAANKALKRQQGMDC